MDDSRQEFLNSHENMSWLKPEVNREEALKYLQEQSPKEIPACLAYQFWVKYIHESIPAEGARYPTHVQLTGTYPEEPQNPKYRKFSKYDYNIFLTSTRWIKQLKEDYKLKDVYFDGYEFKEIDKEYPIMMLVRYEPLGFIPAEIITLVFDNRVIKDINDISILRHYHFSSKECVLKEDTEYYKNYNENIYTMLSGFFGFNLTVEFTEQA